jgi:hypothetical protein
MQSPTTYLTSYFNIILGPMKIILKLCGQNKSTSHNHNDRSLHFEHTYQ